MASLNTLPDLSTVDIQAIQDSGPILPRPSLPPLTTIAENWDSIEPTERNSENEEESCSEEEEYEDSDEEEERSHSSTQKKMKYKKSQELSCSSSSAMEGSLSECSDSDLSDITSDSEYSSSSSSGSDSDSHSSNSSSSTKSSVVIQSQPKDHPTFSVREANYEQGRVTLRLAALQLGRKSAKGNNIQEERSEARKPIQSMGLSPKVASSPCKTSPLNAANSKSKANITELLQPKPSGNRQVVTPIKLRRKSSSEIPKAVPNPVIHSSSIGSSKQVAHSNADEKNKTVKVAKTRDGMATKRSVVGSEIDFKESIRASNMPSSNISNISVASSHCAASGPMLSDLDSDGDELYLPAVSEAIRMLDLDSQGSANIEPTQPSGSNTKITAQENSTSTKALATSSNPQQSSLGLLSLCNVNNPWPAVGCCSSILQQFAAKSQSGEPPLPHLPVPHQLTKGARKSFPPNDEPLPAIAAPATGKNKRLPETLQPVSIAAGTDHDLDVLVPMRGLDCHPSHVSPDSGIQSVSGSPFSVHSSPIHPGANGINSQQSAQQQLMISPCPPRHSPSPPPQVKPVKSGAKRGRSKQNKPLEKSRPAIPTKSSGRRPRSCRDTAIALSSGLEKDSSFVQAIQRGLNDALRLTGKTASEKESVASSKDKSKSMGTTLSTEKQRKARTSARSVTKNTIKQNVDQPPISNPNKQAESGVTSKVTEKDPSTFRNEIAAQLQLLISKGGTISTAEALGGLNKNLNTVSASNSAMLPIKRTLETTELLPFSPRQNKRKKKRKKHKSSSVNQEPGTVLTDPSLQRSLELLCQTLDRCSISRVSIVSSVKIPCIFQCRKYATSTTLGSNSRSKRKKIDEDLNVCNAGSKRKSKMKKNNVQENHLTMPNASTEKENEPAVISATELSLPLKKRHHHLPATESQAEETTPQKKDGTVNNIHKVDSCSKDSSSEKPSQDQVLLKSAVLEQHLLQPNRKRAASGESTAGTCSDSAACDTNKTEPRKSKKKKKMRGRKKYKEDIVAQPDLNAVIEQAKEEKVVAPQPIPPLPPPPPTPAVVAEQQVDGSEQLVKKRGRRRKAFNRTGFPTAKKKRKKVTSSIPCNVEAVATSTIPTPTSNENSSQTKEQQSENVASDMECIVSNKAKKPRLLKDDDSDILLPEPTSSESPSSDELAPAAVLLQQTGLKKRRVPRWRKRYLTAGLFSNYFKEEGSSNSGNNNSVASNKVLTYDPEEHEHGLLPPPFHCERWLRRRKQDFQLPFDLWWLHQHGKLPGRDTMVPSWNYRKIRTNVYYDVKPPFSNDAQACNCKPPPPDCKDGDASWCGDDCLNRMVYTECSSQLCPNGDRCSNQRIQRHLWAQGLERFMTKEKGWGVRCRNELKSGQFILEYVGEVVSEKEFKERMRTVYAHDTHHYCLHLDGGLVIDGHRMGGDGRFVNHSCSPNCEMQKWSVNGLPRMALFALRDIMPYEELSYDYNFSLFNPAEGQPCKCGSTQCRGVIGGKSQRVNMQDSNNLHQKLRGMQQKRKRKRQQQETLTVATCTLSTNLRPLSLQQRVFVQQHRCFLVRNLETVRRCREREKDRLRLAQHQQLQQHIGRTRRNLAKSSNDTPCVTTTVSAPNISTKPTLEKCIQGLSQAAVSEGKLQFDVNNREEEEVQEEIVNCRCRLFHEEGLMVQCERCETWQHSDCLGADKCKAALAAEHYVCDPCLGIVLKKDDLDIVLCPQPDSPPEGLTFYLSLYYKDLQIRQGDCVYVLRDHDTPDSERTLWNSDTQLSEPTPRCPRSLPSNIKLAELDIFQIERMWIDEHGKKYVWGHHYLRPHETFHEPSRKFYVNEVLHVPIYEAIPIWAVAGRCWVLDPVTFCKGRPVDAVEQHTYICEFRVDRSARLFAKVARSKFSICTRKFAFKMFISKLKPQRTYQPHGAPPPYSRKTAQQNQANESLKDSIKKGEVRKEIKKKKKKKKAKDKAITLPVTTPVVKPIEAKTDLSKIEGQRKRLDEFLYKLLSKNTSNEIEDATHLLHNRGRTRGRRKKLVAV